LQQLPGFAQQGLNLLSLGDRELPGDFQRFVRRSPMVVVLDTNGTPLCPSCGSVEADEVRPPNGALRFRCEGCKKDLPSPAGRCLPAHKLPLRVYLAELNFGRVRKAAPRCKPFLCDPCHGTLDRRPA
jgi:hypothetical protein